MNHVFFLSLLNLNLDSIYKIFPLTGILLSILYAAFFGKLKTTRIEIYASLTVILVILAKFPQELSYENNTSFEAITIIIILLMPIARFYGNTITKKEFNRLVSYQLIIFAIDLGLRIYNLGIESFIDPAQRFYAKAGGLYPNANVNGQLSSLLVATIFFAKLTKKNQYGLILFSLLSLSRTAWIVVGLAIFLRQIKPRKINYFSLLKIVGICTLLASLIFPFVVSYVISDNSFNYKVDFFVSTFRNIEKLSTQEILFGGELTSTYAANLVDIEGFSPHLPLLKVIIYYGFLGMIIYLFLYLYHWRKFYGWIFLICLIAQSTSGLPIIHPIIVLLVALRGKLKNAPLSFHSNSSIQCRELYSTKHSLSNNTNVP